MISGGSNIYPREVEEVLLEHPGVVGGRRRRRAGRGVGRGRGRVHRRLERRPAELDAHLLERIARFKRPKRYEFIDEIAEEQLRQGAQARTAGPAGVTPYRVPLAAYFAMESMLLLSMNAGPVSTGVPPPIVLRLLMYSHKESMAR